MHRLLLKARWVKAIAGVLLFTVVCALLADWQWHRRLEVLARIQVIDSNYRRAPVPLARLLPSAAAVLPTAATWRQVEVQGRYVPRETLVVRGRDDGKGSVGFLVLVPLRLAGGGVLVVDRGWVAPAADVTVPAHIPPPPSGTVRVLARLRPSEPPGHGSSALGQQPAQVHSIDVATVVPHALAQVGGRSGAADARAAYRGAYAQMVTERPSVTAPEMEAPPSTDQGPHLSYTIQWCLFAAGAWGFLLVHMRRQAQEDDVAAGRRSPRAAVVVADPRRRRSDEEVEDAALDAAELAHATALQARRAPAVGGSGECGVRS